MCEHGKETIVATPDFIWHERAAPEKGICIDECIADVIKRAWKHGVQTLSSCCGHGGEGPNVVLTQDKDQPALAAKHLPGFNLYQWLLTEVSGDV